MRVNGMAGRQNVVLAWPGSSSALEDIPVPADPAGLEAEDVHPGQSQKSRAVWMLI